VTETAALPFGAYQPTALQARIVQAATIDSWAGDLIGALAGAGYETSGELAQNGMFALPE